MTYCMALRAAPPSVRPYDVGVYLNGSLEVIERRVEADSPYLAALRDVWMQHFLDAILRLPPLPDR